jgi:hypothetical protein
MIFFLAQNFFNGNYQLSIKNLLEKIRIGTTIAKCSPVGFMFFKYTNSVSLLIFKNLNDYLLNYSFLHYFKG